MGLFKRRKKQQKQQKLPNQPQDVAEQVFDEQYRQQLRQMGREHFQGLLEESSVNLKGDVDATLENLTGALRRHMASQLDLAITRINNEMSNQFKEKMNEYNRVSSEAQELVIQSLSRNAQNVHEKYQQMSSNLQKVIANQEVMMVGVFQDNQSRVASVQSEQDKAIEQLKIDLEAARRQTEQIVESMRSSAHEQAQKIDQVYRENIDKTSEMKRSQEAALSSLNQSIQSLQSQHNQLQQIIDDSIDKHKTMAANLVNENMARVIEHYLIGALGENSDVSKDLPGIMNRLEEHKQAMMDDMKL